MFVTQAGRSPAMGRNRKAKVLLAGKGAWFVHPRIPTAASPANRPPLDKASLGSPYLDLGNPGGWWQAALCPWGFSSTLQVPEASCLSNVKWRDSLLFNSAVPCDGPASSQPGRAQHAGRLRRKAPHSLISSIRKAPLPAAGSRPASYSAGSAQPRVHAGDFQNSGEADSAASRVSFCFAFLYSVSGWSALNCCTPTSAG